jgi:heme/copper-type cytochrome/quinol oxidase subunit 2
MVQDLTCHKLQQLYVWNSVLVAVIIIVIISVCGIDWICIFRYSNSATSDIVPAWSVQSISRMGLIVIEIAAIQLLKYYIAKVIFKNSIHTSKKTQWTSSTKSSRLILFNNIIAVY